MKVWIAVGFLSILFTVACGEPFSSNKLIGQEENWACFGSNGTVELKLSESDLPACTKLSDLPPEDQAAVIDAAENKSFLLPESLNIIPTAL